MLSKKIHQLKTKFNKLEKKYFEKIFFDEINSLQFKIKSQEDQIEELKKEIFEYKQENIASHKNLIDEVDFLNDKILELSKYKSICSKDISSLASAITELYNVLNFMLGGKLLKQKKPSEEFLYAEETELADDEYIDENGKKKKLYH